MRRREFLGLVLAGVPAVAVAAASPHVDRILAHLEAEGYRIVSVGRTLLGRTRIVAENGALLREIVLNPRSGEVLRDYAAPLPRSAEGDRRRPPGGRDDDGPGGDDDDDGRGGDGDDDGRGGDDDDDGRGGDDDDDGRGGDDDGDGRGDGD